MTLYMAVTPDEYELPMAVSDTAAELARKFGIKENYIYKMIWGGSKWGRYKGIRFVKVVIDDD